MSTTFMAQINPITGRKSFNSGRTGIGGNSTGVMMDSIPNTESGPPSSIGPTCSVPPVRRFSRVRHHSTWWLLYDAGHSTELCDGPPKGQA